MQGERCQINRYFHFTKYKSQAIGSNSLCRFSSQALAVITSTLWPKLGFGLIYVFGGEAVCMQLQA